MNRLLILLVMLSASILKLGAAEVGESASYNYYHRNNDGSFVLENIDTADIPVPLFSYKSEMAIDPETGIAFKEITGYYYQSDKVKFVDIVNEDDKIVQTQYFSYEDGNVIFTRFNAYNLRNQLVYIAITGKDFPGGQNYTNVHIRAVFSYEREDGMIDYTGYRLVDFSDRNDEAHQYSMYSQGTVNKSYLPVEVTTKITNFVVFGVKSLGRDEFFALPLSYTYYETYIYADAKDEEAAVYDVYMREDNESIAKVLRAQRGIENGNGRKGEHEKWLIFRKTVKTGQAGDKTTTEEYYGLKVPEIIKTVIENGMETRRRTGVESPPEAILPKTKRIHIKDGLRLGHILLSYHNYTDSGLLELICDDEKAFFNKREFNSNLQISLDIFSSDDNIIAQNYYSPDTPWRERGEENMDGYNSPTQ